MSAVVIDQGNERACGEAAVMVMNAVADGLAGHGLDILGPAWEETHHFKVTNVQGALCEVIVGENGSVSWEYRQVHGYRADPAHVTAMVLGFLGAGGTEHHGTLPGRFTGLTLKGAVGLAARERGMRARLGRVARDEAACEISAEVEVTNPARGNRGKVWVTDEGAVCWEYRPPRLAYAALTLGIAATLAANVAAGLAFGLVGAIVAAWPAAALVIAYELLMLVIRGSVTAAPEPASAVEAHPAPRWPIGLELAGAVSPWPGQGASLAAAPEPASDADAPASEPPAGLNGHAAEAASLFAADVAAGRVPGLRAIQSQMRIGQAKAQQVQAHLREITHS